MAGQPMALHDTDTSGERFSPHGSRSPRAQSTIPSIPGDATRCREPARLENSRARSRTGNLGGVGVDEATVLCLVTMGRVGTVRSCKRAERDTLAA